MERRNLRKSGDGAMTARAAAATEINLPKFEKHPSRRASRKEENASLFFWGFLRQTRSFRNCVFNRYLDSRFKPRSNL